VHVNGLGTCTCVGMIAHLAANFSIGLFELFNHDFFSSFLSNASANWPALAAQVLKKYLSTHPPTILLKKKLGEISDFCEVFEKKNCQKFSDLFGLKIRIFFKKIFKISRFLCMLQLGSQNMYKMLSFSPFSCFVSNQIWLNELMGYCHHNFSTKIE
jgi:hypothetical protein